MKPPDPSPAQAVAGAVASGLLGVLAATHTTLMLHVTNIAAAAGAWAFVAFYASRVKWEKSLTGWNLMTLAVSVALLTTSGLSRRLLGPDADLIATLTYSLVAVSTMWTVLTIRRVQSEYAPPRQRVEPTAVLEAKDRKSATQAPE